MIFQAPSRTPLWSRSEDETEPPGSVEFPGAAENNEWKTWDEEVPLGVGRTGDKQPPPLRPQPRKNGEMKGKGEYTPKRRRETADETESEPKPGADVSGFGHRPDQVTARREGGEAAYHQTREKRSKPTGEIARRLAEGRAIDTRPKCFIRTNPKIISQSTSSWRMKSSLLPAAGLFLLWLVVSAGAAPLNPNTKSHYLQYNNCYTPSATATYTLASFCPTTNPPTPVLPSPPPGFRCQRKGSTLTGYCGVYSHFKWSEVPSFQAEEAMTGEECRKLARDCKIVIQGTAVNVAVNTISSFRFTL